MTDPLTDERIAHDLALAEEASPRPWCKSYTYQAIRHVQRNCDLDCPQHPEYADECPQFGKNDGPFIAAIAESGPVALREVQRLRALCKEAYDELGINNFEAADLALIKALEV